MIRKHCKIMIDNKKVCSEFDFHLLLGDNLRADAQNNLYHHFIYFKDNKSVIRFSDGSERTPSEGAVCYIAPKVGYKIINEDIRNAISGIACTGALTDSFAKMCNANIFHITLRPKAVDTYTELLEKLEKAEGGCENVNRTALTFYKLFIEIVFSQSHIVESKPALIAQHIKEYIDQNIVADISVTSIAKQFYLSETHVIRVFRDRYGVTPKQYILKVKIDASKLLLLDTSLQIKEIAMTYHFADSYHFSHTFKRFTGISPEKFRMREDERRKN